MCQLSTVTLPQALPQFGILQRSNIGLMVWEGESEAAHSSTRQPGSRLKTPAIPIWVTSCCGHYGVLFNSNRELLRNYHAEKRFELHYYTCAGCYLSMTVDTRGLDETLQKSLQRENSVSGNGNGGGGGGGTGNGGSGGAGSGATGEGAGTGGGSGSGQNSEQKEIVASPLERLIHTKWMDAKITFHGPAPPSLNY